MVAGISCPKQELKARERYIQEVARHILWLEKNRLFMGGVSREWVRILVTIEKEESGLSLEAIDEIVDLAIKQSDQLRKEKKNATD